MLIETAAEELDDTHVLDCNNRMVRAVVELVGHFSPEARLDGQIRLVANRDHPLVFSYSATEHA